MVRYCPNCHRKMHCKKGTWQLEPHELLVNVSGKIATSIPIDSYWCSHCAYAEAYDKQGNVLLSGSAEANHGR